MWGFTYREEGKEKSVAAGCPGPATMTPSVLSAGSKIIPKGAGMRPTIGEAFYPPYGFSGLEI